MPEGLTRSQIAVYAVIAVAVVALGAKYLRGSTAPPAPPPAAVQLEKGARAGGGRVVVHVAGAVRSPGVYRLRPGARVDDAIQRAGGPTRRADLSAVNLAAKAEDGRQILVPERPRAARPGEPPPPAATAPGAPTAPAQPVNLNTATLEQLDTLDGIGPGLAQAILDHREENGGFGSIEDLAQVPGIGEKRMASLREQVTV
ncbi:MAG TPA: helix-hairpin-helix domain-containing protein [Solirubrobacteraceae bacterium]|nr:helix-hairpin-helix domain-containing protein [Solirubrobacteraceae bacterium]